MCQSYSHYNRSNTLKIQLCSICQIDVPCIPHLLLDSCHMCCTACSNEQNTYNSKEKCYNLHYRKTVALSKTQDFQSVCWKAFSAIKAHLTLTLIKANRQSLWESKDSEKRELFLTIYSDHPCTGEIYINSLVCIHSLVETAISWVFHLFCSQPFPDIGRLATFKWKREK